MSPTSAVDRVRVTGSADAAARVIVSGLTAAGFAVGGPSPDGPDHGVPMVLVGPPSVCTPDRVAAESCSGTGRLLVVVVGGPASSPWDLLAAGATDVLDGDPPDDPASCVPRVVARLRRWLLVDQLIDSAPVAGRLIGSGTAWRGALRRLVETGRFSDASVLITGESGTGKELAARLIHALDPRRSTGPFVVVDCASIVASLSAPELFGHERGAFTGAHGSRAGAFAEADGGVLLLDEIGELPPVLQPELLRVVQERAVKPLGSARWQRTDFRLVCATHRDLGELERAGTFRADLRARLSAVTVPLPSLDERREDVPALVAHFLREMLGPAPPVPDPVVDEYLRTRAYPGNVRELRQLVARMSVGYVGDGRLTAGMVPEAERPGRSGADPAVGTALRAGVRQALLAGLDLVELKATVAELAVDIALGDAGGHVGPAARRLGVTPRALQKRRATPERALLAGEPAS